MLLDMLQPSSKVGGIHIGQPGPFGAGGGAAFNSQQLLSFQRRPSSQ